ncbi:hypothetical protein BZG36_03548 [Bifiguratus adelaidae]|uniref:Thioredoxin domain-containing protein n=1 Tax=Bifiguratus adelaidae TaxID=1938954 RepID=A0A261XZ74_9FUNG|nr:hypothetical protein BZG36_03548 [Bifiguratus adelaidae]
MSTWILLLLVALYFLYTRSAQGSTTSQLIGTTCPELTGLKIVKGQPVNVRQGRVVVEFWATWCPPCRTSIPHLTQLAKKYGISMIGVTNETDEAAIKAFVDGQRDKMDYTVAMDRTLAVSNGLMKASGLRGIPCAFIIEHGVIVWHGYVMQPEFEERLAVPLGAPPQEKTDTTAPPSGPYCDDKACYM